MLKGLRTVIYRASDLSKAKIWYTAVLGIEAYFSESFYVGFNVGGFELGLDPDAKDLAEGTGGVIAYWAVENADLALTKLIELGATPHREIQDVGGGIRVASVIDPFGNVLGIVENPHFKISA